MEAQMKCFMVKGDMDGTCNIQALISVLIRIEGRTDGRAA